MSKSSSPAPGQKPDDCSLRSLRSAALLTATACLLGAALGVRPGPSLADGAVPIQWGGAKSAGVVQAGKAQSAPPVTTGRSALTSGQYKWSASSPSPHAATPTTPKVSRGIPNGKVVPPTSYQWKPKAPHGGGQGSK